MPRPVQQQKRPRREEWFCLRHSSRSRRSATAAVVLTASRLRSIWPCRSACTNTIEQEVRWNNDHHGIISSHFGSMQNAFTKCTQCRATKAAEPARLGARQPLSPSGCELPPSPRFADQRSTPAAPAQLVSILIDSSSSVVVDIGGQRWWKC